MQATSGQIYSEFENSLVSIVTKKGEQFVARIIWVTGGIQIGSKPTIPESTFLEIDRFIYPSLIGRSAKGSCQVCDRCNSDPEICR
jgi:hypothetical protein